MGLLQGQNVVVVGGSQGVGRSIVEAAHREGASVLAVARGQIALLQLSSQVSGVQILMADATEDTAPVEVFSALVPDGLGAYPTVTLAKARAMAGNNRVDIAEGRDPIAERDQTHEPTFLEAGRELIKNIRSEWSNTKHYEQWVHTVEVRCASLHPLRVSSISTDHILKRSCASW